MRGVLMPGLKNGECQQIINQINQQVKKHHPENEAKLIEIFGSRLFESSSLDELKKRDSKELYAILESLWGFCYQRDQNETKIRVFNPDKETDGFESSHTIIEISQNDIPFLVDTTRML